MTDRPEFFTPWWNERMAALAQIVDSPEFAQAVLDEEFLSWPEVDCLGLLTNDHDGVMWEVEQWGTYPELSEHPHWITQAHHGAIISACMAALETDAPLVVEFGGGFGSMAHIAARYFDGHWSVVDSEPMRKLQGQYWESVGAPAGIFSCSHDDVAGPADVFVGTWSVSEATEACHDWLIAHDWFGAPLVFLAADLSKPDDFGDGCGLVERLEMMHGFDVVEAPFPGSVYITRGFAW